jgi:hypothetical protein
LLLAFLVEKSRFFGGVLIAELESTFGICSNRRFGAGDERLFTSHAATGKGNFFADRCGRMEQRQAPPDQSPVVLSRL